MLCDSGAVVVASVDPHWNIPKAPDADTAGFLKPEVNTDDVQRTTEQWRQCEWWRRRVASSLTMPIITVDDLLSFRSRCFVLDVRSHEDFLDAHFQASTHIPDPDGIDLGRQLPADLKSSCGTPTVTSFPSPVVTGPPNLSSGAEAFQLPVAPGHALVAPAPSDAGGDEGSAVTKGRLEVDDASEGHVLPWLFNLSSPNIALRVRLVVVVGGKDFGASFAERLACAGIRHTVCLLGGIAALKDDAPRYLVSGPE